MGRFTEARGIPAGGSGSRIPPRGDGRSVLPGPAEAYGLLGDCEVQDPERRMGPYRRSLQIAREWVSARPSAESRYFLLRALGRWGMFSGVREHVNGALDSNLARSGSSTSFGGNNRRTRSEDSANLLCFDIGRSSAIRGSSTWEIGTRQRPGSRARRTSSNGCGGGSQCLVAVPIATASSELAEATGESDPARAERLFRRSLALTASAQATPRRRDPRRPGGSRWASPRS
jgi:hypothetical protein